MAETYVNPEEWVLGEVAIVKRLLAREVSAQREELLETIADNVALPSPENPTVCPGQALMRRKQGKQAGHTSPPMTERCLRHPVGDPADARTISRWIIMGFQT